ncbi:MAG: S8 family serine peptidase [Bacteroidetes bacterium]|nr:S8 family serine peptidase [Bacteroidota bacterium]MBU1720389.1 S8 family serine peptidase [Bacteroidota bacterium]
MRIFVLLTAFLMCISGSSIFAQKEATSKYWVFFTDKQTDFNPCEYFDPLAIQRRLKNHVPLADSTDFPVNSGYIQKVGAIADSTSVVTRWFNAIVAFCSEKQVQQIRNLAFVKSVEPVGGMAIPASRKPYQEELTSTQMDVLKRQVESLQGDVFEKKGITGKGIRIAIFDGGFPGVDTIPVFAHIRKTGRIIKTYDFTRNKEFVYSFSSHGTMVMSCIAGISGDFRMGLATGAEFLLARTEVNTEPFSEEENWLAAVEWADKNGAHIINSSLGYTYHRYFTWDMDGKKSLVTRAANMAASKGILVVNAAGNDGANGWKKIGAPADADSVISVGGIDPTTDFHISFSSYGPTADKRLKPNVCAFGDVVAAGKKSLKSVQGTSFASPLVAGFAACAMQTDTTRTTMELFREIEKSGSLYPYYDYAHGYGVPQASYFTEGRPASAPSFEFKAKEHSIAIIPIAEKIDYKKYMYCHIEDENGIIEEYWVTTVNKTSPFEIDKFRIERGQTLLVQYNGYVASYKLKK